MVVEELTKFSQSQDFDTQTGEYQSFVGLLLTIHLVSSGQLEEALRIRAAARAFVREQCRAEPKQIATKYGGDGRASDAWSVEDDVTDSIDDQMIDTPDGPMRWADWKKKNPVQVPSRRTKGKALPTKVKKFTDR